MNQPTVHDSITLLNRPFSKYQIFSLIVRQWGKKQKKHVGMNVGNIYISSTFLCLCPHCLLTLYMPIQQLVFFLSFSGCWNCGSRGHLKSQCPSKALKTRERWGRGAAAGRSKGAGASRRRGGAGIRGRGGAGAGIGGRAGAGIGSRAGAGIGGRGGSAIRGRGASRDRGTMRGRGRGNRHVTINRGRVINIYYK